MLITKPLQYIFEDRNLFRSGGFALQASRRDNLGIVQEEAVGDEKDDQRGCSDS